MKRVIFFLLISLCFIYGNEGKKTICLNMIVKDESQVIERCLASVKPLIDTWVIVDTGSTDGTQNIVKTCLQNIPGQLHQRPWVDFAHNRNEALALAQGKADYILIIDADDYLQYTDGFQLPELTNQCYLFRFAFAGGTYKRPQLIQSSLPWKWVGVLHEYLHADCTTSRETLEGIVYVEQKEGNRSQDPEKYAKDAQILEAALQEDPTNDRYTFYLAQSYRDGGDKEKALAAYLKRVAMGGWDEEIFYSLYSAAKLKEEMGKPYREIVDSYTQASTSRPTRAEPLYRLALFFRNQGNFLMGYAMTVLGLQLQQPDDMLFVESWVYHWGLLLEQSICAYWLGHYHESLELSLTLLRINDLPDNVRECVEKNIQFAIASIRTTGTPKAPNCRTDGKQ